jgi:hypothetical protein
MICDGHFIYIYIHTHFLEQKRRWNALLCQLLVCYSISENFFQLFALVLFDEKARKGLEQQPAGICIMSLAA